MPRQQKSQRSLITHLQIFGFNWIMLSLCSFFFLIITFFLWESSYYYFYYYLLYIFLHFFYDRKARLYVSSAGLLGILPFHRTRL